MRTQLTELSVRSMKPAPKQVKVWDTRTRGFGVLVSGATKSWFVCYGAERRLKTLGRFPAVGLADARRKAQILLGTMPEPEEALSFSAVRDLFLDAHKLSPRAAREMRRILLRHFNWSKKLDQITHNDVMNVIDAIKAPSEALHAFKSIRTFFNWSVPRYLKHSPCAGLKPPSRYVPRTRVLAPAEVKQVWNAVDGTFGVIVRLCLLTGQRWGEIARLKWDYIGDGAITFPTVATKNRREHMIPLGAFARSIIDTMPRSDSTPYVFAGRGGGPWNGAGKCKWQLDQAVKLDPWTLHDLRRTFATQLAALGTPIHVTERLLNHVSGTQSGIVAVYQRHDYPPEMRVAIECYEAHLSALLASDQEDKSVRLP